LILSTLEKRSNIQIDSSRDKSLAVARIATTSWSVRREGSKQVIAAMAHLAESYVPDGGHGRVAPEAGRSREGA
jgi:hypothetical protein